MENQMKKMLNKKTIVLAAAIVCIAAMLAAGTLAYFVAEETAYNVITTGTLDMILHEETDNGEPWPEKGITGVVPGTQVTKKVYVENDGTVDFYARIKVEKAITAAEGVEAELNFEHITLDINTEKWTENKKDGYYYYNTALKPGEATEPLFTAVSFGPELGNEYQNCTVEITVYAEAVQSKNNGDSALTASGWTSAK